MILDLAVLALLAAFAVLGALSGALRQLVSLAAVALGVLAARAWGDDVAAGLGRMFPLAARFVAPLLLFLGTSALASLVASALLRATRLARIVRGPSDRGAGALLGGAKGALAAWLVLSALALAGRAAPEGLARQARASDFANLARTHNLVSRLDPDAARALERAIEAARSAERAGRLDGDPESARLLADPRIRALAERAGNAPLDPVQTARVLDDPELRALVERLAGRVGVPSAIVPATP